MEVKTFYTAYGLTELTLRRHKDVCNDTCVSVFSHYGCKVGVATWDQFAQDWEINFGDKVAFHNPSLWKGLDRGLELYQQGLVEKAKQRRKGWKHYLRRKGICPYESWLDRKASNLVQRARNRDMSIPDLIKVYKVLDSGMEGDAFVNRICRLKISD